MFHFSETCMFVAVVNCVRILTRVLPYIFEDPDWRGFFWSNLPAEEPQQDHDGEAVPLANSLINALCVRECHVLAL